MTHTTGHIPQTMQECIAECTECHNICLATVAHCLELGGVHACRACADDCERMADGDAVMLHCVQVCRRCAACERMAA